MHFCYACDLLINGTQEAERLEDFGFEDPDIQNLLKQMELLPGEERDASFKRGHSPESVASEGVRSLEHHLSYLHNPQPEAKGPDRRPRPCSVKFQNPSVGELIHPP